MMDESQVKPVQRSRLVTFVAWTFIVMAGFSVFGSLLQNVMMAVIFSQNQLDLTSAFDSAFGARGLPAGAALLFENIRLLSFIVLLVSAAVLYISIEFLRRREWARIAMIVILSLSIVWTFAGLALQYAIISPMLTASDGPFSEPQQDLARMMPMVMFSAGVMSVLHAAVSGWLIVRFVSPGVKAEFQATH